MITALLWASCTPPDRPDPESATTADTQTPTQQTKEYASVSFTNRDGLPQAAAHVISHDETGAWVFRAETDEEGAATVPVGDGYAITLISDVGPTSITVFDVEPDDEIRLGPSMRNKLGRLDITGPKPLPNADGYRLYTGCGPKPYLPAESTSIDVMAECANDKGLVDIVAWAIQGEQIIAGSAILDVPLADATLELPEWDTSLVTTSATIELPEAGHIPGIRTAELSYGTIRNGRPLLHDFFVTMEVNQDLSHPVFDMRFAPTLLGDEGRIWATARRSVESGQFFSQTAFIEDLGSVGEPVTIPQGVLQRHIQVRWDDKVNAVLITHLAPTTAQGSGISGWVQWPGAGQWRFAAAPDTTRVVAPELPPDLRRYVPSPTADVYGNVVWLDDPTVDWATFRQNQAEGGRLRSPDGWWTLPPQTTIEQDNGLYDALYVP